MMRTALWIGVAVVFSCTANAAQPKLDKDTCDQLKTEQATFARSGIANDVERGPTWAKANLPPERLREIEHYLLLDEQLKFGCRQATISIDALRAGEAARALEINPNPDAAGVDKTSDGDSATDTGAQAAPSGPSPASAPPEGAKSKPPAVNKPRAEKRAPAQDKIKVNDAYSPTGAQEAVVTPRIKVTDEPEKPASAAP